MTANEREGVPAAQYVRKSTEHQRYSLDTQLARIHNYADARGFTIVKSYVDAGRSGVKIDGRGALQQLLADVLTGDAPYRAILVYDVSRWGRFQNIDESAYYEYTCKRAGVSVHYCAEQFDNDGTALSTIIKNLKRVMAAEFSRELGVKVFNGQKHSVERGFCLGSQAGFALRRMLVDDAGNPKHLLKPGERKHLASDRSVLVPGPKGEIERLHWIFEQVIRHGKYETAIARELNQRRVPNGLGTPWNYALVYRILRNPKYIGENIWNRTTQKLGRRPSVTPPSEWVRSPVLFQPIIPKHTFEKAQQIFIARGRRATNEEVLSRLDTLLTKTGALSANLIDQARGLPSFHAVLQRFGSLKDVYRRLGYDPAERRKALRDLHRTITRKIRVELERSGAKVRVKPGENHSWLIDDRVTLHVIMLRCRYGRTGPRWRLWRKHRTAQSFVLAIRMGLRVTTPEGFYLFPPGAIRTLRSSDLGEKDLKVLSPYHLDSINELRHRFRRS